MDSEKRLQKIRKYAIYLQSEERSENTVTKYIRDLRAFFSFMGGGELTKTMVLDWKDKLIQEYAPTSVNSMLAAVNGFFDWLDRPECKVKPLKFQQATSFLQEPCPWEDEFCEVGCVWKWCEHRQRKTSV